MRLVCKTRIKCDVDQRAVLRDLRARGIQTPHEQIAIGAGPIPHSKLAGKLVASESSHGFQFRGADHARFHPEKLAGPFERGDVEVPKSGDWLATRVRINQSLCQAHHETIHSDRFAITPKGGLYRGG